MASLSDVSSSHSLDPSPSVVAISAIKPLYQAKSRLHVPGISAELKQKMVLFMLLDTHLALKNRLDYHYIVTPDTHVARFAHDHGLHPLLEQQHSTPSLNSSLEQALLYVRKHHPHSFIMIVQPDLPAISPPEAEELFSLLPHYLIGLICDKEQIGTTVLTFSPGHVIPLHFGVQSALQHRDLGAQQLPGEWSHIQHDVDNFSDLTLFDSDIDHITSTYTYNLLKNYINFPLSPT